MFDLKKLLNSTQLALLGTFGLTTKYCAHIGFDSEFYLETYPDVAQAQVDPLGHYIRCGRAEGRIGKFEFCGERGGQQFDQRKTTILIAVHQLSMTGAPILGYNLAAGLSETYNIVGLSLNSGPLQSEFVKYCTQLYVPGRPRLPSSCSSFSQIVNQNKICAVLANSVETQPVATAAKKLNLPTVGLVHEFVNKSAIEKMQRFADCSDFLVFSSKLTKRVAEEILVLPPPDRVLILAQGQCIFPDVVRKVGLTDVQRLLENWRNSREFICIGCGTVEERKGVDLFVEAATELKKLSPLLKFKFIWIGDGPLKPDAFSKKLQHQIEHSKLEDEFRLLPSMNATDLAKFYGAADCFFLSSRFDPLPNVCIDAFYAGIPVICFKDATGIAEYINRTAIGEILVIEQLNAFLAAQAILRLSEDKKLLARARKSMRNIAKHFDMKSYISHIKELLERSL